MRYGEVEIASYHGGDKTSSDTATINERPFKSNKRATVCISSQIGCAMKCTFCATGTMGMIGNLSAGEIIEQIVHANTVERIRNVVFMGMGEVTIKSTRRALANICLAAGQLRCGHQCHYRNDTLQPIWDCAKSSFSLDCRHTLENSRTVQ